MHIAVVGTGYVGLVSGVCFAEMGNQVTCVDIDARKVESLRDGRLTIYEPGLEVYFDRGRRENRLRFTTDLAEALAPADVVFLALPTPPGEDGSADLRYVLGVADDVGRLLAEARRGLAGAEAGGDGAASRPWGYKVIVDKSTVPVGTSARVTAAIEAHGLEAGEDFDVVSNPEFLREGAAVDDFMKPERVVVGTDSERAAELMTRLYEPFVRSGNPILVMDEASAEMTKYAANAMLATKITFMNEVANLCDRVGADVDKVRRGIGTDSRIGPKFLYAGIGFGGSCFPKDVQALHRTAGQNGYDFRILQAVLDVNEDQKRALVPPVLDALADDAGRLDGKTITVWGLAFKPHTDDVREAPAHVLIREFVGLGADVVAFDPEAVETTRATFEREPLEGSGSLSYAETAYDAAAGADALVVATEWPEFRRPDLARVRRSLKPGPNGAPLLFDGRNVFEPGEMAEAGFAYRSIGRPAVEPLPIDDGAGATPVVTLPGS
ncbi:UDP-glucose dehydrogenase family protein [Rubrivirga marina]|uniref:UDP-glucose 6-dehydrogenase n=1 Tax=Rubrivirga marina TaxID=1196024 RepID=A0A271IXX8_9BACT|nr:UDP-glucose/GDP-mannose dehydrogenase family protein [Rubrivirga marina]PAP75937.1 UDP-glucose 6-dehydrogenase [Rubrivirga marina]